MHISATLKSKFIIFSCVFGMLQGCTTRTITNEWVNIAIKENDSIHLVVGRKWFRSTQGADWEEKTVLKEQSEYYKVPLDFSNPELHLNSLLVNEKSSITMYHPVANALLPIEIDYKNERKMNPQLFSTVNSHTKVDWEHSNAGLYGYSYLLNSDDQWSIVQKLYNGETCSFQLKNNWLYLRISSSNDGRNAAVFERNEANNLWRISVYSQCKKVLSKEIENQKFDVMDFYNFEKNNDSTWFILRNVKSKKFFKSNLEFIFVVPNEEFIVNNNSPMHKPIFDPASKKLYWFSNDKGDIEDSPNLQMALTEYDLVTKKKRSILLKLGKPLH